MEPRSNPACQTSRGQEQAWARAFGSVRGQHPLPTAQRLSERTHQNTGTGPKQAGLHHGVILPPGNHSCQVAKGFTGVAAANPRDTLVMGLCPDFHLADSKTVLPEGRVTAQGIGQEVKMTSILSKLSSPTPKRRVFCPFPLWSWQVPQGPGEGALFQGELEGQVPDGPCYPAIGQLPLPAALQLSTHAGPAQGPRPRPGTRHLPEVCP